MAGRRSRTMFSSLGRAVARAALPSLFLLYCAVPLRAGVIYVSTATGSDANSGLLASAPKSTLTSAFAAASPGDTIRIASGVYNESLNAVNKSVSFEGGYSADFLSRDYAVLRSTVTGRFWVNTSGLTVNFDGLAVSSGTTPFLLYWFDAAYSTVTISNSVVFNSSAIAIDTYGSQYFALTVASNTIYNCRTGVALGPATARSALIYNNTISELRTFGGDIGDGKTAIGIDIQGSGPLLISSNTITGAEIFGIDGVSAGAGTVITGNLIADCGSGGSGGYSNGGIRYASGVVQILNNLILRCRATALILGYNNFGSVIANNTIAGANTVFAVEDGDSALFKNNIIINAWYGFAGTDIFITELSHNIFGDISIDIIQSGLYDFREAGLSFFNAKMHDNIVVPAASTTTLFFNSAAGNYHLAADSIAIDAGAPADPVGAEPAPNGARIDCGAYGGTAQGGVSESSAPAAVANLSAASGANIGEIGLTWSAPGDDGNSNRNIYGSRYELRYATYPLAGYTTAQWWGAAAQYSPQDAWVVAEDTSVTRSINVASLAAQPMGVPGFAERRTLTALTPGAEFYFMLKTTDNSGNVSGPDTNSLVSNTMAHAAAQSSGNSAPVLGHTAGNALGPLTYSTDGGNTAAVRFRVKDADGAVDISTLVTRSDQYYTYGPQYRVDGGIWNDIETTDIYLASATFTPAADFSGAEYTMTWFTTGTVLSAETPAAEFRFRVTDGQAESMWAGTGPFTLDNRNPSNPGGAPVHNTPVSVRFGWSPTLETNFLDYRVIYATYTFSQCQASAANRAWTSADDTALAVKATTFTVLGGLAPGVTYWYYVEARDAYGHRSSGANCIGFSTVTLLDHGAPGPVTDLAAYTGTGNSGQVRLEWTVPGNDGASGDINDGTYLIKYSTLGLINSASFGSPPQPHYTLSIPTNTVLGQKNTITLTGLTPGASYWFAIKVKDSAELWSVWNSSQDAPSDNNLAFALGKDYGNDPPLAAFSGNFPLAGGAVYDGTGPDELYALALDTFSAGGPFLYAVGKSSVTPPIAFDDYMIVKYDMAGSKLLSAHYHYFYGDAAYAALVPPSGGLLVTGQTTTGNGDWLTLKFDANLDLLASAKFNGAANMNDAPYAMALDAAGNVLVAGTSRGTNQDFFVIKYTPDLSVALASASFNAGGSETAYGVAADAAGNVVLTGDNSADFLTVRFDSSLAFLSSATFNGSGNAGDTAYGVVIATSGHIYVAGREWGSGGNYNYVTLKYAPDLSVLLSSAVFNGPASGGDSAYAVALDTAGNILVAGESRNGAGNDDFVTLKYGPELALLHADAYDSGFTDSARAVVAGPGGYAYIGGYSANGGNNDFRVIRRVMSDTTAPAGVTDLSAQSGPTLTGQVTLAWTAPGDDGAVWNITGGRYELKYSSAGIITAANYASPPVPAYTVFIDTDTVPGQAVAYQLTGLQAGASYWFALKTRDEAGNWSVWASSADSPGDNNGAYGLAKLPGNAPPLGVFSGDFGQAGGASYDGTGADSAYGVAVDTFSPGGPYIYVVGASSMTGGGQPNDWLVTKYSAAGIRLIAQRFGGASGWDDYARAVTVDKWGYVIVGGYVRGASFDDFVVVKYDQNLDIVSSATYNGSGNNNDQVYGVATDSLGNIIAAGVSRNASNYDYFTVKYSPALAVLSSATYNKGGNEYAYAVAVDPSDNIIVTGTDASDFFTIKYSPALAVLSSAAYAGSGGATDTAYAVAVDPSGNIIVAGDEWGASGWDNYRVVKYAPDLSSVLVSTSFNGAANSYDYAYAVTADTAGNITVAGASRNGGGNDDIVALKYSPNLSLRISTALYDSGYNDTARALAAAGGYVYAAGFSANGSNNDMRALRWQFPDLPPPPALAGAAAGVSSITWSWNDVQGETGYRLVAATGGIVSADLAANTASWVEEGLSTNTAYARQVVALNMPGTSTSTAVTRWTLAAPPSGAAAAVLSSEAATVSWSANTNPAGTDYEVSYSSADAFLTHGVISTAPLTQAYTAALTGLQPYTTYYFRVRAYNGAGLATAFAVAASTRTDAPPPDAQFVSQSVPAAMRSGAGYSVSVTMRNTGPLPWTKAGFYRLGSQNPTDTARWGTGRVELADGDSIPQGGEKTFTFTVTAPPAPGPADFQWRMIQEGVLWFGGQSPNVPVAISSNAAEFVSMSVPEVMIASRAYRAAAIFKNTGDTIWTKASQFRLGSQDPADNTVWLGSTNRVELGASDSVGPGQNATYYFTVTAPTAAATYAFQWRMLEEAVQWFPQAEAVTPSVAVTVAPALTADRKSFVSGEVPAYTLAGAAPNAAILWSSWKNGAPAESAVSLGQTTDAQGGWSGSGAVFAPADAGFWIRQALIGGATAEVRYSVGASLTAPTPSTAAYALSASHVAGDYRLTAEPFLLEGAKLVANLNPNAIFVYMTPEYSSRDYPATDFGATPASLAQLAQTGPFQELFSLPFSTYVITAYSFGTYGWVNTGPGTVLPPEQAAAETAEIHDLAAYLLQAYQGTGKTFILKNWEGDWALNQSFDQAQVPAPARIAAMTDWLNARHAGVIQARAENPGLSGVRVADAVEFNLVDRAHRGVPCLLSHVAGNTASDYLSYSAWETVTEPATPELRRRVLDDLAFVRAHPAALGRDLIIAEYGFRENAFADPGPRTTLAGQAFLDAAVPLAFYWQILDNECENDQPAAPGNCPGHGLLRQDGARTPAWSALRALLGAGNDAAFTGQSAQASLRPGGMRQVAVTMRNDGNRAWDAANGYKLASAGPDDNSTWGLSGVALSSAASVLPGQSKTWTFTVTAPASTGTYNFQWRMAQEGLGAFGSTSAAVSLLVTDAPPPQPVLAGSAAGVSGLSWTWADAEGEDGYRLITSTGGDLSGALPDGTAAWGETALSTNTAYTRLLTAYNASGASTSAAVTRWTLAARPSDAAAAVISSTTMSVSWGANANPAGTDYEVSYSSADAFLTHGVISTAPLTQAYSAGLAGLQPYTTYYVRVRAYSGAGLPTDFAVAASTRTNTPPPPAPVFFLSGVGTSSVAWAWTGVDYGETYAVYSGTAALYSHYFAAGAAGLTDSGLSPNVCLTRFVSAYNVSGSSASAPLQACTLAAPPASPATAVLSSASLSVNWADSGNSADTVYEVSYSSMDAFVSGAGISTVTTTAGSTSTVLAGLQPYTEYFSRVRAINLQGVASVFAVTPATRTNPGTPPVPALGLAVLGVSSINWTWADTLYEDGYRLAASTGGAVSPGLASGAVSWTETGLSTNTLYSRTLEVFNISGTSVSAAAAAWTLAAQPAGFVFTGVQSSSLTVSWEDNGNPAGTDYTLSLWKLGGGTTTVTTTNTQAAFTGLTAGASYYAALTAENGAGSPTAPVYASTLTVALPAASASIAPGAGGTVTLAAPPGAVTLAVPAGAFAATVAVTLEVPASFPDGAASLLALAPAGVGAQITLDLPLQPSKVSELTLEYRDADVAGLDEDLLVVARYDTASGRWARLDSTPQPALNRVTARVDHFSLFQVMAYLPSQTSSGARAYPNPCAASAGCAAVTFSHLKPGAKVYIYTLSGELLRVLTADSLGFASWDTRNSSGKKAARGVYLALAKGGGGNVVKVALIR